MKHRARYNIIQQAKTVMLLWKNNLLPGTKNMFFLSDRSDMWIYLIYNITIE